MISQDGKLQTGKRPQCQSWPKRREQLKELSTELLKVSNMRECMLEVQGMFLRKLAAEENRMKDSCEPLSRSIASFGEKVKEVEEMIRSMQY